MAFIYESGLSQLARFDHNSERDHLLDRLVGLGHMSYPHSSIRYQSLMHLVDNDSDISGASQIDQADMKGLLMSIPERTRFISDTLRLESKPKKGWLSNFYQDPYSFFVLDQEDLFLKIDPVLHFQLGDDTQSEDFIFQNTRGIKIRGLLDDKVYFYSSIFENQQQFLPHIEDEIERIGVIPGQGFFRPYQSGVIDDVNGWDFLNAQGYVGWKLSKSIDVHLGHGRHFIGNGMRSMLLSDYANNYFYLQFNTRVSIFHLQNTFAELSATGSRDNIGDRLLPKKYMASHYLDIQISPRWSIGLFESVIFSRGEGLELQYLNPVILYRTVEQVLDSPDNVLLGLNTSYHILPGVQLYGQLMIDELRTDQAFSGNGWWGNKIGYQLGLKAYDILDISQLDIQAELNSARPYTYAHRDDDLSVLPLTSYTHFNQALAHPYGANFREFLFKVSYRPLPRLQLRGLFHMATYGDDPDINVGRDILKNYANRESDTGNFTGQGIRHDVSAIYLTASWTLAPSYFVDVQYIYRNENIENDITQKTKYIGLGFRANVSTTRSIL